MIRTDMALLLLVVTSAGLAGCSSKAALPRKTNPAPVSGASRAWQATRAGGETGGAGIRAFGLFESGIWRCVSVSAKLRFGGSRGFRGRCGDWSTESGGIGTRGTGCGVGGYARRSRRCLPEHHVCGRLGAICRESLLDRGELPAEFAFATGRFERAQRGGNHSKRGICVD